ncbi:MAG: hypothetical protein D6734_11210 [Candidatus Schekmanbacteria bacterium]|nr:MAG: hypothetical protein D6734_11210 [Candidatus Schekmanbacteria bacterium]
MLSLFAGKQKELVRKIIKEADSLLEKISSGNSYDREAVSKRAVEYLKNSNWQVRNIAVKMLGVAGEKKHLSLLVEKLLDDNEVGFVKRNSAIAIRQIGVAQDDVKKALINAVGDKYWETRAESIKTLAKLYKNDEEAFYVISKSLIPFDSDKDNSNSFLSYNKKIKEKNFEVRAAIAQSMEYFLDLEASLGVLGILLDDESWVVRAAALNSLKKMDKIPEILKKKVEKLDLTCESFKPIFPLKEIFSEIIKKSKES